MAPGGGVFNEADSVLAHVFLPYPAYRNDAVKVVALDQSGHKSLPCLFRLERPPLAEQLAIPPNDLVSNFKHLTTSLIYLIYPFGVVVCSLLFREVCKSFLVDLLVF